MERVRFVCSAPAAILSDHTYSLCPWELRALALQAAESYVLCQGTNLVGPQRIEHTLG